MRERRRSTLAIPNQRYGRGNVCPSPLAARHDGEAGQQSANRILGTSVLTSLRQRERSVPDQTANIPPGPLSRPHDMSSSIVLVQ
jgi:hypothetical protein